MRGRVTEALTKYIMVHGKRILSGLGDQEEVKIENRGAR